MRQEPGDASRYNAGRKDRGQRVGKPADAVDNLDMRRATALSSPGGVNARSVGMPWLGGSYFEDGGEPDLCCGFESTSPNGEKLDSAVILLCLS